MSHTSVWLAAVVLTLAAASGCRPDVALDQRPAHDRGGEGEGEGEGEQCAVDKAGLGANAVFFGTRSPSHVVLSTAQQRAVIGLQEGGSGGSVCSGTLITDTVVLTATHCTRGTRANRFQVLFGVDDRDPEAVIDVVEKTEHPNHDIAMLRLSRSARSAVDVAPIAAFAGILTEASRGEIFEQAGYGATETGGGNGRFFVAEVFDGIEDDTLRVNGEGRHGVCFGDSGGPSLRQTDAGDVRVMGALSWGDESCVGVDRYTRVDLVQDWIAAFAGPIPLPGSSTEGCGSVDERGGCSPDARVVEYCDNGLLRTVACSGIEVCADSDAGKRCIPVADNPCGAATDFGSCENEVLTWCDDGVARTRDCRACGGDVCGLVDNVAGYACVEDACGGIDFRGVCDGDVARWCSDGALQERDCAQSGSTCGFVDDDSGYFCR